MKNKIKLFFCQSTQIQMSKLYYFLTFMKNYEFLNSLISMADNIDFPKQIINMLIRYYNNFKMQ